MFLDLKHLTKTQKEAVAHTGAPLLLVAGAGTGKTMTLVYRLAHLLEQGVPPKNIVAISFTEKSAQELEDRLYNLVGSAVFDMTVATFHGFGEKILRDNCILAGLAPTFELLDEKGQWQILFEHLRELGLKKLISLNNPAKNLPSIIRHISRLKDEAVTVDHYFEWLKEKQLDADSDTVIGDIEEGALSFAEYAELASVYGRYEILLEQNNRVDFGDLILRPLLLMQDNPKILEKLRAQYQYLIVDEFQDTNFAQYEFLRLLAGDGDKLTVVGDDDQAIYKFRGASVYNILHFQADFKNAKTLLMTDNFRNPQSLLDVSYKFIQKNNPERLEAKAMELGQNLSKKLVACGVKGKQKSVEVLRGETVEEEKKLVAKKILALKYSDKKFAFSSVAVIARSNDTASDFARALSDASVPNIFLASFGLYRTPVALDVLAFLRLTINGYDNPSLYRLLQLPFVTLAPVTIMKMGAEARRQATSLWEQLNFVTGENEAEQKKINDLRELLQNQQRQAHKPEISALTLALNFLDARLGEISYKQYLISADEDGDAYAKQQIFYLDQFLSEIKNFERAAIAPDIRNFLASIDAAQNAGDYGRLKNNLEQSGPDAVQVLTAHSAKGLEFDYVFIVSLVDKRFPSVARTDYLPVPTDLMKENKPQGDYHLQEERRLFYVALTRARKNTFLSWANDYGGAREKKPSRFLEELALVKTRQEKTKKIAPLPEAKKAILDSFAFQPPLNFSYSALETFRRCALNYKYSSVLKIPVPPSQALVVGDSVHRALQTIFSIIKERQGQKQSTLFKEGASPKTVGEMMSEGEVIKFFDSIWRTEWFFDKTARDEAYKNARNYLCRYFEIIKNQIIYPEHLEWSWKATLGDFVMRGKIDRVDRMPGGVMLIDYKTNEGGVAKNIKKTEMRKQLFLYQLIWQKMSVEPVVGLQFIFLSDDDNPMAEPFLGEAEDLKKFEADVVSQCQEILEAFAADKFKPTTSKAICDYCEFKEICPHRVV